MAYLDKEAYEKKREWAAKRMANNRTITTLTDEQHELLEELCTFRHELHTNQKSAFLTGSPNFGFFADNISVYHVGFKDNDIHTRILKEFGLAPYTPVDYPIDADYEDYELTYEEALQDAFEQFEKINNEIELFLREIDKKHGTNYCPSGTTRIYSDIPRIEREKKVSPSINADNYYDINR